MDIGAREVGILSVIQRLLWLKLGTGDISSSMISR